MSVNYPEFDIKSIAGLAKLSCSDNINEKDIAEIIDNFNTIKSVECETEKTNTHTDMPCMLREDIAELQYSKEDMLRNACHKTKDYICVPKTVD